VPVIADASALFGHRLPNSTPAIGANSSSFSDCLIDNGTTFKDSNPNSFKVTFVIEKQKAMWSIRSPFRFDLRISMGLAGAPKFHV
jgi:hypothetical protein